MPYVIDDIHPAHCIVFTARLCTQVRCYSCRPGVCPSVCLSVWNLVSCIQTAKDIAKLLSTPDSPVTVVFLEPKRCYQLSTAPHDKPQIVTPGEEPTSWCAYPGNNITGIDNRERRPGSASRRHIYPYIKKFAAAAKAYKLITRSQLTAA